MLKNAAGHVIISGVSVENLHGFWSCLMGCDLLVLLVDVDVFNSSFPRFHAFQTSPQRRE